MFQNLSFCVIKYLAQMYHHQTWSAMQKGLGCAVCILTLKWSHFKICQPSGKCLNTVLWGLREPGWYRDIVWLTSAPPNCYWWVSSGDPRWLHKWSPGSNQTNISIVMVRALTNRYKLSNNKFVWVLVDCMVRSWSEDIFLDDSDKIFAGNYIQLMLNVWKLVKTFSKIILQNFQKLTILLENDACFVLVQFWIPAIKCNL